MKVKNHKLFNDDNTQVRYQRSPNQSGEIELHEYLIIHYTGGSSLQSSVDWLTSPDAPVSAHLVIGRDGEIIQLVPFSKKAWHAGQSQWGSRIGLNSYSIGIELDNAGRLQKQGDRWLTWFGTEIPDEDVVIASHKHDDEESETGWHAYTAAQIQGALEAASTLVKKYDLLDVLGHDDIAPYRKIDPGPAFAMDRFRAHVLGLPGHSSDAIYQTTTRLNIRSGPGTTFEKLIPDGLPEGTRVMVMQETGNWRLVDVLTELEELDLQGWVHGRYLTQA